MFPKIYQKYIPECYIYRYGSPEYNAIEKRRKLIDLYSQNNTCQSVGDKLEITKPQVKTFEEAAKKYTVTFCPPKTEVKERYKLPSEILKEYPNNGLTKLDNENKYDTLIRKYAAKYDVEPELIKAIIRKESRFDEKIKNHHSSASGLMQMTSQTAKNFGVKDAFNPEENIEGGTKYVRYLIDMFNGDVDKAVTAYLMGEGNAKKGKTNNQYLQKVYKYYESYKKSFVTY